MIKRSFIGYWEENVVININMFFSFVHRIEGRYLTIHQVFASFNSSRLELRINGHEVFHLLNLGHGALFSRNLAIHLKHFIPVFNSDGLHFKIVGFYWLFAIPSVLILTVLQPILLKSTFVLQSDLVYLGIWQSFLLCVSLKLHFEFFRNWPEEVN